MNNRNQKTEDRRQKSEDRSQKTEACGERSESIRSQIFCSLSSVLCPLFSVLCLLIFPSVSQSVMKGLPEGKPRVEIGDAAPIEHPSLHKARETGKAIILMFGNPDHCIYCEKVWGNIRELMPKYKKDVVAVLISHRASKFQEAADEDRILGERYGVIGEPWLFMIDKEGIVRQIFPGLTGINQIEEGIKNLIKPQ
ncbi:MAG: thioredoxin fold domain-containing protein [Nitrospinae bacterium]|nr:thioredoxin fold domain-containing protein [Nitrospinota bacterium]MBI3813698.1 thioredoxin fold domain-containing protein [Nitrospinota bacterium]